MMKPDEKPEDALVQARREAEAELEAMREKPQGLVTDTVLTGWRFDDATI